LLKCKLLFPNNIKNLSNTLILLMHHGGDGTIMQMDGAVVLDTVSYFLEGLILLSSKNILIKYGNALRH